MKLTAQVKLCTDKSQASILRQTLETSNLACNYISKISQQNQAFSRNKLHKLVYHKVRQKFKLPSQITCRCIAKVIDSYKIVRRKHPDSIKVRKFHKHGGIPFDDRNLTFRDNKVSLSTKDPKRLVLPYVCGEYQKKMLAYRKGESDLVYNDGQFYLLITCDIPDPEPGEIKEYLGVDLGINKILVDSDGVKYQGKYLKQRRHHNRLLRAKLQSKGTKSAKRRLKARRRKEARFAKNINHVISKRLVEKAQRTKRAIVLEDLKGIRSRVRVRKSQRSTHSSWSFYQLQSFIEYKALMRGVTVIKVNPSNTSRTCLECGHCDKGNRVGERFKCKVCTFVGDADFVGAVNVCRKGRVNAPGVVVGDN